MGKKAPDNQNIIGPELPEPLTQEQIKEMIWGDCPNCANLRAKLEAAERERVSREALRELAYTFGQMSEDAENASHRDGGKQFASGQSAAFDAAMTMLCEHIGIKVSDLFKDELCPPTGEEK